MREKEIVTECLEVLHKAGIRAWRTNAGALPGMQLAPPGTPDIIGYTPDGRFVGVEVKRPGRVPTEIQTKCLTDMHDCGCIAWWVTSAETLFERICNMRENG